MTFLDSETWLGLAGALLMHFFSMRVRVANDQFTLTSPDRHVQCGLRQRWFEACESNYSRAQIPNSKRNFRINLVKMRWV